MKFLLILSSAFLSCQAISFFPNLAQAQISADGTLSTTVINNDGLNFTITDGNQNGTNLFHSFDSFSVPTGGSAIFNHGLDIQTIFSRVTGNSISNIDGLLQANGSANLFLLNPNGIVFGPNARLNLGGSFIGSSADRILFADGSEFSATSPNSPTLTVNIPIGLQFRENPGTIINRSQVGNGLEVTPGNTLALLGGDLIFDGGFLSNNSGRIELSSVGDNSEVSIASTNPGYIFGYDSVENFRDIQLFREAFVSSSGNNSNIQIRGRQIELRDGAQILMAVQGSETVGRMTVIASELIDVTGTSGQGQFLTGLLALVEEGGTGQGGNLTLETRQLNVREGAQISTSTFGVGNGGNLTVRADRVELIGSNNDFATGLFATAEQGSTGSGGSLHLESDRIVVLNGAQVAVTTFSSGSAGNLRVFSREIELSGERLGSNELPISSGFFAGTDIGATGEGGNLTIETERLLIQDGAEAQTTTLGDGDAGNLIVRASESVELIGRRVNQFPTGLLSVSGLDRVSTAATGQGGSVTVLTPQLTIQNGAEITVSADGTGNAGQLNIQGQTLTLNNQGQIRAETATGTGGNIEIQVQDLQLRDNSILSTTAGTEQGPGNGGNINIDTQTLVGIENSDITANAFSGSGGGIDITSEGIFGLQRRQELTENNDITAFSQVNPQLNGEIGLNTPDVDPTSGLIALPENVVDPAALISQNVCAQRAESEFIITGRGGLPPSPNETLSGNMIEVDLVEPATINSGQRLPSQKPVFFTETVQVSIPARGWRFNENGEVVLTAEPQNLDSKNERSLRSNPACQ